MNKLLVIGHKYPEPQSSAAGTRMMQLIGLFKENGYTVTFASEAQESEHAADLDGMRILCSTIKLNDSSFDAWISKLQPDIVVFDRFMMEEQFGWRVEKSCPNAIRILDTEDLHFLRKARGLAVKQNRELSDEDLKSDNAKREIASIFRSDLSIMISRFEMELLVDHFGVPNSQLFYLSFLVNKDSIPPTKPYNERRNFLSIGNFLHEPNWDATQRLKQVIWPFIREALPMSELHVYGAYASEKVQQLHDEKQGFLIKGRAENAISVMSSAKVLLAPLRFGAGLKGKLFESMLCGTPSVTTMIGAEGMSENQKWNGAITNDELEFARMAVELYENEGLWSEASAASTQLLKQFEPQQFESEFSHKLSFLSENLSKHRSENFIGSMLLYHTQRSTEFMSRWIEEKNRSANSE